MAYNFRVAKVTARVTINSPRNKVFEYLSHLKYHFLWNPHLRQLEPIVLLQQGTVYKSTSQMLGIEVKGNNQITVFKPDEEIEISNTTGALKYRVRYGLKSNSPTTTVTCTTEVSSESSAFAFATPVLKVLAQRELQSDLRSLKVAVENQLKP
jgi:hypothetical protein